MTIFTTPLLELECRLHYTVRERKRTQMSLDLSKVISQVGAMVALVKGRGREHERCLQSALEVMRGKTGDLEALRRKVAASKTSWLVADPAQPPASTYPAPAAPSEFTVMATDGSHIDVDRHRSTRCYLINIGSVVISYGSRPDARLESTPHLCSEDEDLVLVPPPGAKGREVPVEGALLGVKRAVDELRALADLAAARPPQSQSLALLDGTLILWSIEPFPEFVSQALLQRGFLADLERIRALNADRALSIASYISYPRSTDVLNLLKITVCPQSAPNCDNCLQGATKPCDLLAAVRDRDIFAAMLQEGERSALFVSASQVQKRYGPHRIYFFYLLVEGEIARIEVPEWVAADVALLDLTHALILDQCRRGHGYPVVLSEAHEQAVVSGADREVFWEMVDNELAEAGIDGAVSAKSLSKRTRWV